MVNKMKYTEQEIKDKIEAVYTKYADKCKAANTDYWFCWGTPNVEVSVNTDARIVAKLDNMYEAVPFNSEVILMLCEAFDTKHINETDKWSYGGCETCDWGSSYGFELEFLF